MMSCGFYHSGGACDRAPVEPRGEVFVIVLMDILMRDVVIFSLPSKSMSFPITSS